jgi:hypothetical protein
MVDPSRFNTGLGPHHVILLVLVIVVQMSFLPMIYLLCFPNRVLKDATRRPLHHDANYSVIQASMEIMNQWISYGWTNVSMDALLNLFWKDLYCNILILLGIKHSFNLGFRKPPLYLLGHMNNENHE